MTVPVQRGSMALLQPPRSRFMITDILAGSDRDDGRSPSPQGPRDLSVPPGGHHRHDLDRHISSVGGGVRGNHHDNDSDSDSSGQLDDHSVCSNGKLKIHVTQNKCRPVSENQLK